TSMPLQRFAVIRLATPVKPRPLPPTEIAALAEEFSTVTPSSVTCDPFRLRLLPGAVLKSNVNDLRVMLRELMMFHPLVIVAMFPWIVSRSKPVRLMPTLQVFDTVMRFGPLRSVI